MHAVIPTRRGTTAVVGKGFSEESISTIELQPNEWPRLSETGEKHISVPVSQVSRISSTLPTLIRLKSNNKPEVIIKVLSLHAKRSTHWIILSNGLQKDTRDNSDDSQRLHMHRVVCDLDSVRDQADGEPKRVAGAARGAGGDFVF